MDPKPFKNQQYPDTQAGGEQTGNTNTVEVIEAAQQSQAAEEKYGQAIAVQDGEVATAGTRVKEVHNANAEKLGLSFEAAVSFPKGTVVPKAFSDKYDEIIGTVTSGAELKARVVSLLDEYSYLDGKLLSYTTDSQAEMLYELSELGEFLNSRLDKFPEQQRKSRAVAQVNAMLALVVGNPIREG